MHDPKTGKKRREKRQNMVRFGELKIGNRSSIIQAIRTPFSIARRAALHCRRRPNPQAERTEVPFSCHPARETKMAGDDQIWRKRRRKQRNDGCTAGADAGRNRGTPGGKLAENWRQESAMRRKVRMEAWLPGEMIRRGQLEEIYP